MAENKDKKIKITVWVNESELNKLMKTLGVDQSKAVRACMDVANNIIHVLFGGEITNIFKRRKDNEELELYDNVI